MNDNKVDSFDASRIGNSMCPAYLVSEPLGDFAVTKALLSAISNNVINPALMPVLAIRNLIRLSIFIEVDVVAQVFPVRVVASISIPYHLGQLAVAIWCKHPRNEEERLIF
jgi:hypothetical protein